jgi:flagellar hook protein FlgE
MSILASLYTGISGMGASGAGMGIISDNIANAQSTGFKASRGEFTDVVASNLKGILGGNQIGRGAKLSAVTSIFTQGNLTPSERDTDMAIRGDGFFVARNPLGAGDIGYTRDGSFRFDSKGRLTTNDGYQIQGYRINQESGKSASDLTDIEFSGNTIPAKGTVALKIDSNLDVRRPTNLNKFDVKDADKTADLTTSVRVYDSTGTAQNLTLFFYKSNESEWSWHATADGGQLQGGKEGTLAEVAAGRLTFTRDGKLNTDELLKSNLSFKGSEENQKVDFNFGDAIVSRKGTGLVGTTQYGSKSQIYRQVQDGYSAGTLTNFSVDDSGIISGSYSNGVTRPLAQIAVARFENNEGLFKLGNSRFKEANMSGQPLIGTAGESGRGTIASKALESSNVDLANEFVKMMTTQRNFQANAKTITTSDELLQEVIQLKR